MFILDSENVAMMSRKHANLDFSMNLDCFDKRMG